MRLVSATGVRMQFDFRHFFLCMNSFMLSYGLSITTGGGVNFISLLFFFPSFRIFSSLTVLEKKTELAHSLLAHSYDPTTYKSKARGNITLSYDYLPKNIFRKKYSVFLQKSGLDALYAPSSHLLITRVATGGWGVDI